MAAIGQRGGLPVQGHQYQAWARIQRGSFPSTRFLPRCERSPGQVLGRMRSRANASVWGNCLGTEGAAEVPQAGGDPPRDHAQPERRRASPDGTQAPGAWRLGEKGFSDPLTEHPASGWRPKGDRPPRGPVPSSISSPRSFAGQCEYSDYRPLTMRRNANVSR